MVLMLHDLMLIGKAESSTNELEISVHIINLQESSPHTFQIKE